MIAVYLTVGPSESPANREVRASRAPAPRRLLRLAAPVWASGTVLGEHLLHAPDGYRRGVGDGLAARPGGGGGEDGLVTLGHGALEGGTRSLSASPECAQLAHGGGPLGGCVGPRHKRNYSRYRSMLDSGSQRKAARQRYSAPGPTPKEWPSMHPEPTGVLSERVCRILSAEPAPRSSLDARGVLHALPYMPDDCDERTA